MPQNILTTDLDNDGDIDVAIGSVPLLNPYGTFGIDGIIVGKNNGSGDFGEFELYPSDDFYFLLLCLREFIFSQSESSTFGLTLSFIFIANLVDQFLKTDLLFDKRFYFYLLLIVIFTLIFNGYLTWRPVVTYGVDYQLDFRIITIPVEDFFYGISLLWMNTSLYKRLLKNSDGSS